MTISWRSAPNWQGSGLLIRNRVKSGLWVRVPPPPHLLYRGLVMAEI